MTKQELIAYFSSSVDEVPGWHRRNRYYYKDLKKFLRRLIPPGVRVCEIGSGTAELLDAVEPAYGVGVDLSETVIARAQKIYPHLTFIQGDIDAAPPLNEQFDYIILSDLVGYLEDLRIACEHVLPLCHERTRVVVTQYNRLWYPILKLGEWLRLKHAQPITNWISQRDLITLFELAGFEVITRGKRLLFPKYIPLLGVLLNRILAPLPLVNRLCVTEYIILRPRPRRAEGRFSVSVIVPARNEKGTIQKIVETIPSMGTRTEIIFVEGGSTDGTAEEIARVAALYERKRNIKTLTQDGKGKADAVRKGFAAATGDILMILDADLSTPPEVLPAFYEVVSTRRADYAHGTRLIYPLERRAMPWLNFFVNHTFGILFSWILGQHITDTLCGTKVLFKKDYELLAAHRASFGADDPFGDFDLICGAARFNLKITEIPVHHRARVYGSTNIRYFASGVLLLKILMRAAARLKFA